MGRVQDKVALVTGGASGIGFATAKLLLEEGAKVVVTDLAGPASLHAVAALAHQAPTHEALTHEAPTRDARDVSFQPLDVVREDDWILVTDRIVRDHGRLDILVNNAGIAFLKDIEATTLAEWRELMAVNLDGTFLGCKHAIRVMKNRGGGSIINLCSIAGMVGYGGLAAYCASKGGVRLLTKSVALHCARKGYNIRCNSVHPSFVETPMLAAMIASARDPEKMQASCTAAAPLSRLAQPVEVARMILFLASEESAFTTGAELVVDGGLTAA